MPLLFLLPTRRPLRRVVRGTAWLAVLVLLPAVIASADEPDKTADLTAVRAASQAYRDAMTKGDTNAVRESWTADGDIVDGWGNRFDASAAGLFTPGPGPRPDFRVGESRLRMIAPDVVIEDGSVDVVLPGMTMPIEGWFSALWVRRDDAWKLAGVREAERPVTEGPEMLDDLDWMVGEWALDVEGDDDLASAMTMSARWDAGRGFLIQEARVPVATTDDDASVIEMHQRIGWDPLVRRIRSWSFTSDGSRGEATWFRDGDSWIAERTAVLPSGRQETVVSIYSFDGTDRCTWRILPEGMESDDGRPTKAVWIRVSKETGE
jgi:hypothetical protein